MKNACPACGAELSFIRNASSRFDCPKCGAALRSNSAVLILAAIGLTFVLAVPIFFVFESTETLGGFYIMLLAELLIALAIYAALGRRYYTVRLDKDPG